MPPKRTHRKDGFDSITITDDFMFGTVFLDSELCKGLLETILDLRISELEYVERQELLDQGPLSRAGIMDILVTAEDGTTFDVEMQNRIRPEIARRARYYSSLIDTTLLGPGDEFSDLHDQKVIFICGRDPFSSNLKRYNYLRTCIQNGKPLNDGTELVFVNAQGTEGPCTPGLDAFLAYLRDAGTIESDYVKKVDDAVRSYRDSPEWRKRRMLWSEKYRDEFAEAHREGQDQMEEQMAKLMLKLQREGHSDQEIVAAMTNPQQRKKLLQEFETK